MKPKFSFIIPTLNEGRFIGDCLKSIKQQKRKDYEIIVVDSHSKDNTVKIARKYRAKIFLEYTNGPGKARNIGAAKAKGSILVFPDADVRFQRDFLNRLDKKFTHDIGGCIFFLVTEEKDPVQKISYNFSNYIVFFLRMFGIHMTNGSCFVYRKDVFKKAGRFNPKMLTNEDHDMAQRAARIKPFMMFPDIQVFTSSRRAKKKGILKMSVIYVKSTMVYVLNHGYLRDYWQ